MWRFYAVATLVVVALGGLVFARRFAARDWDVTSPPDPHRTPTLTRGGGRPAPRPAQTFSGDASWVMSALPNCFDERTSLVGASEALRAKLPPAGQRLAAGSVVRWDPCVVTVAGDSVTIARGADMLRVPPHAALYRTGKQLILVWERDGRTEIRTYRRPAESAR